MSKKANKKNQEKLKLYLEKNDTERNNIVNTNLREQPCTDKIHVVRGVCGKAR